MLIAKTSRSHDSPAELIRDLTARVRQAAEVSKSESLFPGFDIGLTRQLVSLAAMIGSVLCWLVVLFGGSWFGSEAWRFGFAGLALLLGLYNRIDDRAQKRLIGRQNQDARIGLGALVQANDDLFDPNNEQAQFGLAIVTTDPELQAEPVRLIEMAASLFAWAKEGVEPVPESLREVVLHTRDERVRFEDRVRLPREWAGNDETWLFDLFMDPELLPVGCIDRRLWPVLFTQEDWSIPPMVAGKELWWDPESDLLMQAEAGWEEEETDKETVAG